MQKNFIFEILVSKRMKIHPKKTAVKKLVISSGQKMAHKTIKS
jgi:hypothetical protein